MRVQVYKRFGAPGWRVRRADNPQQEHTVEQVTLSDCTFTVEGPVHDEEGYVTTLAWVEGEMVAKNYSPPGAYTRVTLELTDPYRFVDPFGSEIKQASIAVFDGLGVFAARA